MIALRHFLLSAFALSGSIALAQGAQSPANGEPVCLAGQTKGLSTGAQFFFAASSQRVSELQKRGFSVVPCERKTDALPQFQSKICEFAQAAPPAASAGFERRHGITPAELCQLAEEI